MSSKHSHAAQLIKRGLYDDVQSFSELEQRISALGAENTKIIGDAFEVFVEGYLATHQKLQADTVWLVGQLPLEVRQQLNLPNDAKGIDGVFRTRTGSLVPYQVKFRSQRSNLTFTEVAPFLGLTERATDRIIFTNCNDVADDTIGANILLTSASVLTQPLCQGTNTIPFNWRRWIWSSGLIPTPMRFDGSSNGIAPTLRSFF